MGRLALARVVTEAGYEGAVLVVLVPLVRRRLGGADPVGNLPTRRMAIAGASAGMMTWAIVLAPAAAFSYGLPQHTNQIGLGALSATTGGSPLLIGPGALSYQLVLAAASTPSMLLGACLEFLVGGLSPERINSTIVVLGFLAYGAAWAAWFALARGDAPAMRTAGAESPPHWSTPKSGCTPDGTAPTFVSARSPEAVGRGARATFPPGLRLSEPVTSWDRLLVVASWD